MQRTVKILLGLLALAAVGGLFWYGIQAGWLRPSADVGTGQTLDVTNESSIKQGQFDKTEVDNGLIQLKPVPQS